MRFGGSRKGDFENTGSRILPTVLELTGGASPIWGLGLLGNLSHIISRSVEDLDRDGDPDIMGDQPNPRSTPPVFFPPEPRRWMAPACGVWSTRAARACADARGGAGGNRCRRERMPALRILRVLRGLRSRFSSRKRPTARPPPRLPMRIDASRPADPSRRCRMTAEARPGRHERSALEQRREIERAR